MAPTIHSRDGIAKVPLPGEVISIIISMLATTVLTLFLTKRVLVIKAWNRLPLMVWLVFAIYSDSYLFVVATAVLQHSLGVNSSLGVCEGAIILCLVCYVTTKFIYLFLAEKAYIIRGTTKPRLKSKLYLVNSFVMLGIYIVVAILNFIFRITRMQDGQCIIGMRSVAMIPLISFDAVVNVYLTIIFLIPLKNLYSFSNMPRTPANIRLRMVAFRTFCGAVCTLVSSIVNLSVLMALNGEPGWVCLMCCNCDILFSAVVIQWVTSKDNAGTLSSTGSFKDPTSVTREQGVGPARSTTPQSEPPSTLTELSPISTKRQSHADGTICDDHDENETLVEASSPKSTPSNSTSTVLVTTTIEHESKPCDDQVSLMPLSAVRIETCRHHRHVESGVLDGNYPASQTRITAGSRLKGGLDRKSNTSFSRISRSR